MKKRVKEALNQRIDEGLLVQVSLPCTSFPDVCEGSHYRPLELQLPPTSAFFVHEAGLVLIKSVAGQAIVHLLPRGQESLQGPVRESRGGIGSTGGTFLGLLCHVIAVSSHVGKLHHTRIRR